MSKRKCIYTQKDAQCKDKVIPHGKMEFYHNWANAVPCSLEYKEIKINKHPTELEFQIARAFYNEELALQEVEFWRKEGDRLRSILSEELAKRPKSDKPKVTTKDKEIDLAIKEKEIKEIDLSSVLAKRKVDW